MLTNNLCGVNTGHRRGFIHKTGSSPYYLLMVFRTPFFVNIDGKRMDGNKGDAILQRPSSTVIHGPQRSDESFVNDWIYFSDNGDGTLDALPLPFDRILTLQDPKRIGELITSVMEESVRNDAYSPRLISDAIYQMLSIVCRATPQENTETNPVFFRFREAREHILSHYGNAWTLESMAKLTGYSVSRFCALYTSFFGNSPLNELLEARLDAANELLSLHAYKVGDVAEMCGFSSIHYFSGFIKRRTGRSPSEY